jgi:hypothetical protein
MNLEADQQAGTTQKRANRYLHGGRFSCDRLLNPSVLFFPLIRFLSAVPAARLFFVSSGGNTYLNLKRKVSHERVVCKQKNNTHVFIPIFYL